MPMTSTLSGINTIFFDFGSTLIYTKDPWPLLYKQADQALLESLQDSSIRIRPQAFSRKFGTFLDYYYADRGTGVIEKTAMVMLRNILAEKGHKHLPDSTLRQALDALYAVTQKNWYLEEDAIPTLRELKERGFRLGMISNTSDADNVQQLMDRFALRPFFENVVTSADCSIRKPDGRIFHLALQHFNIGASQAAMVGDTPDADILGANRLGIFSIWITRRANGLNLASAQPDAKVETLREIPDLFPPNLAHMPPG
jgi:HAD superfamily hydrolase (TIGR01662 family)